MTRPAGLEPRIRGRIPAMKKPYLFLLAFPVALLMQVTLTGCPLIKPIARTVSDIAHDLCVSHYQDVKPTMSPEEIAKGLCATEEALKPFVDALLSAKQQLARPKASASADLGLDPAPVPSVSVAPKASASAAPAPSASAKK